MSVICYDTMRLIVGLNNAFLYLGIAIGMVIMRLIIDIANLLEKIYKRRKKKNKSSLKRKKR